MSKDHLKKIWTGPETGDPKPIIYLSGNFEWDRGVEALQRLKYFCQSYFYSHTNKEIEMMDLLKKQKVRCFLDSGAFSYQVAAKKKGHPITRKEAAPIIDQYCDWIYKVDRVFDFIVTFDYAREPAVTDWATQRIETRGLQPLSVYHYGAPIRALKELAERYPFLGIGGMVGTNLKLLRPFLDHVFNFTEKRGTRLHGFGVGGSLIGQYPWFSVDSVSWLHYTMRGIVRMTNNVEGFGEVVHTSERRAVIKNGSLEGRYGRAAHNVQFWVDYMYRLSARSQKPQAKRSLF